MGRLIDAEILTDYIVEHDLAFEYAIQHQDRKELERLIAEIPTAYDPDKVVEQLEYNVLLYLDKDGEKVLLDDAIEIVKAGGNTDLLMDRAKSKSGERIPYDGKWK